MSKIQNRLSFSSAVLAMVVLINASVVTTAYLHNAEFYWALLFSIPALVFAVYYWKVVSLRKENDRKTVSLDHNVEATAGHNPRELTTTLGSKHCTQPYQSSIISFENLPSDCAIETSSTSEIVRTGKNESYAATNNFNDGITANPIWRIDCEYEGCRDHNSKFSTVAFSDTARHPGVKMIELELNQVGSGRKSPATENRLGELSSSDKYPNEGNTPYNHSHTAFGNADSMSIFLDSLRELSGRKPIGISLSISDKTEFHGMCFAFRKTGIIPDFLVIHDGTKKGNFHFDPNNNTGMGLYEALLFASKTLELYGLKEEIKIIAVSEIFSPFDVLRLFALGSSVVRIKNHSSCTRQNNGNVRYRTIPLTQKSLEDSRGEILNETLNLMKSMGYSGVQEITLAGLLRDVDALYPAGFNKKLSKENQVNGSREKSQTPPGRKPYTVTKGGFEKRQADFEILN